MFKALRESFRVLKPGRMFAMLLTSMNRGGFEDYVALAQEAGFDLVNVKSACAGACSWSGAKPSETFLIYFAQAFHQARAGRH